MKTATLFKASAIFIAVSTLGGGAWAIGEFTGLRPATIKELHESETKLAQNAEDALQKLDNLSDAMLLIKFQLLSEKQKRGGLEFSEMQELCRIVRVLGYVGVPGC